MSSNSPLPKASVYEKLKTRDPNALDWILSRSKIIQQRHHEQELEKATRFKLKPFMKGFASAFGYSFSSPRLNQAFLETADPNQSLLESTQMVGDYMRAATFDYLRSHNLVPDQLGLTDDEAKSLLMHDASNLQKLNFSLEP